MQKDFKHEGAVYCHIWNFAQEWGKTPGGLPKVKTLGCMEESYFGLSLLFRNHDH